MHETDRDDAPPGGERAESEQDDRACLVIDDDGTLLDATEGALRLLRVSLEELRAAPPGAFSPEPRDPEAEAAFRSAWETSGSGSIAGRATLRLLDGTLRRVRYLIAPRADRGFEAVLEPISEPTDARPTAVVIGEVLAAWREAERRLDQLTPGSEESRAVEAEIETLRARYQDLFAAGRGRPSG